MTLDRDAVTARIGSFLAWLAAYGETSQDQYDFWASPAGRRAKRLAHDHRIAGLGVAAPFVALDALLPRSRRLFQARQRFPIADAHYAMGFFNLAAAGGGAGPGAPAPGAAGRPAAPDSRDRRLASGRHYLDALSASRSPDFQNAAWGYPFDWEGWFGTFKAGTPFITTTAYCYEAFEHGYELTGDAHYLEMMHSIARFAREDLVDQEVATGAFASSYGPFDKRRVVNASAYRAFLLTRAGRRFQRDDWLEAAHGNIAFVLRSQRPDGSWLYAMDDHELFVDNFHTCFVLKNLVKILRATGDGATTAIGGGSATGGGATSGGASGATGASGAGPTATAPGTAAIGEAVRQGYAFYKRNLLDNEGLPVPFAQAQRLNVVRRELYDLAEGLNLALLMRGLDPDADAIAGRFVKELLDNWTLADGRFVTRVTWFGRNKVPYHRWAQAQTFCALTRALTSALLDTPSTSTEG